MKTYIPFTIILVAFASCIKDDVENTNTAVFNAIWEEMDLYYGGFQSRSINWDSTYQVYAPRISEALPEIELFNTCTEMLNILDDQHIFIATREEGGLGFSSGKSGDEVLADKEFRLTNVMDNYLAQGFFSDDFGQSDIEYQFVYGTIKDENI